MAFAKRTVLASVAGMFLTSMAAAGDVEPYRLSPGDTVEIGIAPIPDRTQRAVVQMDGNIGLPEAAGHVLVVVGLLGALIVPTILSRRWKSPPP